MNGINGMVDNIVKAVAMLAAVIMLISGLVNPELTPFVPEDFNDVPEEVERMTVIENGTSDYVIVCAKTAGDSEYTAALKLQNYMKQISGYTLPIVPDTTESTPYEFIVGKTNREGTEYTIDRSDFGDEDIRVFTTGTKVVIAGAEKRGTLYGVYAFLEEAFGCRWFTKDLIVIPSLTTVGVPVELNISESSVLEYRETDWISPKDLEYSLANRLNSNIYRHISEENGGYMGYTAGRFAHTLTTHFCKSSQYFESHPEYFALHNGERTPDQLCLTNPDVLAIVIDEVKAEAANNPLAQIISLTQHDNQHYCECDSCKALDDYEGAHSGTMITFINAVADAIKDEFPKLAVDTFAYQYTRKAPAHVKPRENVIVRLCSIECCFSHSLGDEACEQNVDFANDLKNWAAISNRLYIWDYTTNYAHFCGPFPDFNVIQENMQFFVENSVVGIYEEGNYVAQLCDGEFAEYRAYMLSRLMIDPYLDYDEVSDEFLKAYYGSGWQYVKEYIRFTCEEAARTGHTTIYISMDNDKMFDLTDNEVEYLNELWAKAKALADNETIYENVSRSELSWRYWKGCNKVSEFSRLSNITGWKGENKKLYNDLVRFGCKRLDEGSPSMTASPDFGGVPSDWRR